MEDDTIGDSLPILREGMVIHGTRTGRITHDTPNVGEVKHSYDVYIGLDDHLFPDYVIIEVENMGYYWSDCDTIEDHELATYIGPFTTFWEAVSSLIEWRLEFLSNHNEED